MKKNLIQAMVDDDEYILFMEQYMKALMAGVCASKSDYIRQMLGLNGSQPTKDAIQDSELDAIQDSDLDKSPEIKDEIADKEAKYSASQLSIDFGKLDI